MAMLGCLQKGFLLPSSSTGLSSRGCASLQHVPSRRTSSLLQPPRSQELRAIQPLPGKAVQRGLQQAASTPGVQAATITPAKLPWQQAMSDVKKRRVLKKIMIIGAGPIIIGQV